MLITSTKNEIVKSVRRLRDRSARRESGQHLIEGERLVFDALEAGIVPETLFIEQGRTDFEARVSSLGAEFFSVSRAVLETVCDTSAPQGIAAAVRTPDLTAPESAEDFPHGLIAALDALQDPGNLGTIIRTADAMGAAAVLLGTGSTDAFSPKALRAAMGSTYHLRIFQCELSETLPKLRESGFSLVCGHLAGEERLPMLNRDCVIVIGNEANGVSDGIARLCSLCRLPMLGRAESLNASAAASILIFETAKKINGIEF